MLQNSEEYLSIIKSKAVWLSIPFRVAFATNWRGRQPAYWTFLAADCTPSPMQIDQATLKLKTAKDQIEIYSQQLREL